MLVAAQEPVSHFYAPGHSESMLPAMEKFRIATAPEAEVESLAARIRDEVVAKDGVVVAPLLVSAWARYPG